MISTSRIKSIKAREILDSRGNPTVACRVTLQSGATAEAKVPSGASTGVHEALELRDGGKRYFGKGVLKAVKNVNTVIAPKLRGKDATKQQKLDQLMLDLDGTPNKAKLGANAILAVSLALAQAAALSRKQPLWKSLRQTFEFKQTASLPVPTMNVLNGGAHANWALDVQECMIVPRVRGMAERVRAGSEVFHLLAKLLKKKGFTTTVGDEGGYAPKLKNVEAGFQLLMDAIKKAGYRPGTDIALATDVASSEFYDKRNKVYHMKTEGKKYTWKQLQKRYLEWQKKFPLISIEDPFHEDDWEAWKQSLSVLKKKSVIVGDDFFVTNVERLQRGIEEKAANAILIKLNQIGSLSETVAAINMAHRAKFAVSVSHRSGETADTTIADLAVAAGAEFIKTGSLSRSDRVEKYNRLMAIEMEMR
ncbi:phosphopyruvate hydratase [Candidatus Uhrbacteria bacterium]|nr:phosphopyruvate hydratase [Candidatus Uhrbacteria bacterium]MBD3283965.1 phosphopyruvate hydratase [Candidatus Uhrbacteria bacterium]